ncbi:unnamed protein product [Rotaria magnacalcarata]|uniref:Uncharacterized protein n=7 Tax=Rotaria magnacalcarata TaxID=392030 RepID=A0A819LUT6_9BILA|nr:unnamed protein product [Rotaria magnacalcarata]CAF2092125.1 unnamed protein product [Rotaria magnacalcarata]CAF3967026.1 unnamed protein product [Rotaria magnacalcarata]CAF4568802.1 unnamed protein product [Rotaria magnacalcarata]CAF4775243.1 unnamed protein product [Rotaria magnacalcarata]
MHSFYFVLFLLTLLFTYDHTYADDKTRVKVRKDPRDFTENDVNNLFEQWEENDEDVLPEDERHDFHIRHPYGKHKPPSFTPEDLAGQDRDKLIKMSKKGQTVMMFASVSGNPTRRETEEITQIWWAALKNALYDVAKYIVDDSRVLFLLQDGSQAYEVKDYLVQQDRCQEVTIDNRPYYGKGAKDTQKANVQDL